MTKSQMYSIAEDLVSEIQQERMLLEDLENSSRNEQMFEKNMYDFFALVEQLTSEYFKKFENSIDKTNQ